MSTYQQSTQVHQQPFIRIPNYILHYSFTVNKLVLPIYAYSAIHSNPNNNFIVDTNISHIVETLLPDQDSRKQIPLKVSNTLSLLMSDVDDIKVNNKTVHGFPQCFTPLFKAPNKTKLQKDKRLQYYFNDYDSNIKGWTKLTYSEYYTLLNGIDNKRETIKLESENLKNDPDYIPENGDYKKWNFVELINYFMYVRYKTNLYSSLDNTKDNNKGQMFESNNTIAKNLSIGKNTVTKYKAQINELGLKY